MVAGAALVALAGSLFAPVAQTAAAADSLAWFNNELGYEQLLEHGHDGSGVTIAIAETGVDLNSPDLEGADIEVVPMPDGCAPLRDLAEQGGLVDLDGGTYEDSINHGTNVAAMIVGQGGEDRIQGVAPGAKLLVMEIPFAVTPGSSQWPDSCDPMKVLGGGRMADAEPLGADILSMSVLGPIQPTSYQSAYWQMQDKALVTGAGNDGNVTAESAGLPGVVTVTATKPGNKATDWAASGTGLTVGAPGEGLVLRETDGNLSTNGAGTSFSAPIVAGTLALGRQEWPDASYNQLIQSLTATATGGGNVSDQLGYGGIDPVKFLENDPSQYPDEPLTYPDSVNADPEWDVIREICDGFPLDETMGYASNYRADAGINPEVVKWLPQVAKDEGWLGMAPDADSWGSAPPSEQSDAVAADEPTTPTVREGDDFPILVVFGIAAGVVLVVVIVVVVILANRKKNKPWQAVPPQGQRGPGGGPGGYQGGYAGGFQGSGGPAGGRPGQQPGHQSGYQSGYPGQQPGGPVPGRPGATQPGGGAGMQQPHPGGAPYGGAPNRGMSHGAGNPAPGANVHPQAPNWQRPNPHPGEQSGEQQ